MWTFTVYLCEQAVEYFWKKNNIESISNSNQLFTFIHIISFLLNLQKFEGHRPRSVRTSFQKIITQRMFLYNFYKYNKKHEIVHLHCNTTK